MFQNQPFVDALQNRRFSKIHKIHRKTPVLESLFNKAARPQECNFIKNRLQNRRFPVKFAKFLRTPFLQDTSSCYFWQFRFQVCSFIKKEIQAKIFFCEFDEIFKNTFLTEHLRMTASCVYLWILRSFSEHLFYTGDCLFHVKVAGFQPAYKIKNYFTGAFQAFCTRTRSSHSKAFIFVKCLKIVCEEVNS